MRLRTLALALALSCGITAVVQAAAKKPVVQTAKRKKAKKTAKVKKAKKTKTPKKFKQSNASKVKPRKAKKVKRTHK